MSGSADLYEFMPIEEVMAKTGLTKRMIRHDIRKKRFPGVIRGDQTLVGRGEFQLHMMGLWEATKPTDFIKKIQIVRDVFEAHGG